MFKKGDTVKFRNGSIGILLDNGIDANTWIVQNIGQEMTAVGSEGEIYKFFVDLSSAGGWKSLKEVYYTVLIGDERATISISALENTKSNIKDNDVV